MTTAYCKMSDNSDVYVFRTPTGELVCKACSIRSRKSVNGVSIEDYTVTLPSVMILHLRGHEAAGDRVPTRVYRRLRAEKERQEKKSA